nr:hypothetical protein [Clostridia bacterium]
MKKVINWLLNAAMIIIVTVTLAPVVLGVLFFIFLFVAIKTDALDGLSRSEAAIAALEATRLSAYTEHAPYHCTTVDDCMTIFELSRYDNHVDNTDLRAGLVALAASTDGWHSNALTPEEYAACIPAEAAFLLPDVTFDAWFESAEDMAFFNQETGLFIHLRKNNLPRPGTIRAYDLTVHHNGYLYQMETHGGFHGDGSTYYALIVPEEERAALEATLSAHADWHNTTISCGDYLVMHDRMFFEAPPLYSDEGTDFEWWSYVDTYARQYHEKEERSGSNDCFPAAMQELGAHFSMNWLCALYDADTGLFIYYEYDS